jgi:hypothetical protein
LSYDYDEFDDSDDYEAERPRDEKIDDAKALLRSGLDLPAPEGRRSE